MTRGRFNHFGGVDRSISKVELERVEGEFGRGGGGGPLLVERACSCLPRLGRWSRVTLVLSVGVGGEMSRI
jgi:hypothetical protein